MQKIRLFLLILIILGSCSNNEDKLIYIGFAVPEEPQYAPYEIRLINYTRNATSWL